MSFLISDPEREALSGLPHLAQLLYLVGLRPFMDYATGVVGVKRGISYLSLSETLYIEPGPGRTASGDPSKKLIRVAIEQLEKAGIIARIGATKKLVFRLNHAKTDNSAPIKQGTNRAQEQGRAEESENPAPAGVAEFQQPEQGRAEQIEQGTPPVSGRDLPPPLQLLNSSGAGGFNKESPSGDAKGSRKTNKERPSGRATGLERINNESPIGDADKSNLIDISEGLIYPKNLTRHRAAVEAAVKALPADQAQIALDELSGALKARDITNPPGYLRTIVSHIRGGTFTPDHAERIAAARVSAAAAEQRLNRSNPSAKKTKPKRTGKTPEAITAYLKRKGKNQQEQHP